MTTLREVWSARTSTRARVADYLRVHQAVQGYPATSSEIAAGIALAVQSGRGGHGAVAYHLDALENLVTACKRCNLSKHDRTPEEWQP